MTYPVVRNISLAALGGELLLALAMLAGYQAWIEPGAPRHHKAQAEPVTVPAAETPVPAAAPPVAATPAPVAPAPATSKPAPKAVHAPAPVIAKKFAPPAAVAPVPVPAPVGSRLASPAPAAPEIIQKGVAALNARDYAAALSHFRQARQLQPANADLGYLMGMALESTGEPGAALDAFRSCDKGPYAQIAQTHVKRLLERLRR